MFDFTTLSVYNNIIVSTLNAKGDKPDKGANVIINKITGKKPYLRIGNTRFDVDDILEVQEKKPTPEYLAKVTFDIEQLLTLVGDEKKAGIYRIALYISLSMASNEAFYSNDFVYKGKPLFIEFPVKESDEAADIAKRIVSIAKKYMLFVTLEQILNVTADGANVTFEGVNGYQQLRDALLQRYNEEAKTFDCCNNIGEFETVIAGVPVTYSIEGETLTATTQTLDSEGLRDIADDETAILPGIEAFGDYNWMIHNLRLPTAANTSFWSPNTGEMPVVGGNYVQFSIRMCKDVDKIAGEVVGQRATSVTNHIIYVLEAYEAQVKLAITGMGITISTDADDVLEDPYANAE